MISNTKLNIVILEQNSNAIVALIYKIVVLSMTIVPTVRFRRKYPCKVSILFLSYACSSSLNVNSLAILEQRHFHLLNSGYKAGAPKKHSTIFIFVSSFFFLSFFLSYVFMISMWFGSLFESTNDSL